MKSTVNQKIIASLCALTSHNHLLWAAGIGVQGKRGSVRAGRSLARGGRSPSATSPSPDLPLSVGCSSSDPALSAAPAPKKRPTTRNSAADVSPCGHPRKCDIALHRSIRTPSTPNILHMLQRPVLQRAIEGARRAAGCDAAAIRPLNARSSSHQPHYT